MEKKDTGVDIYSCVLSGRGDELLKVVWSSAAGCRCPSMRVALSRLGIVGSTVATDLR
jgi:hypothetical protein